MHLHVATLSLLTVLFAYSNAFPVPRLDAITRTIKMPFVGYSFVANEEEYGDEIMLPQVGYSFVPNEGGEIKE